MNMEVSISIYIFGAVYNSVMHMHEIYLLKIFHKNKDLVCFLFTIQLHAPPNLHLSNK